MSDGIGSWLAIVALAGAAVYGIWFLPPAHGDGPSAASFDAEQAEERLLERVDEYTRLRLEEDWVAVYDLVDPAQRASVPLAAFLAIYGHGVLKTHTLEPLEHSVDETARLATVRMSSEGELVVANMPPQFQRGFQMPDDPSELRRRNEFEMTWAWNDGDWFYRVEDAAVDGTRGSTSQEVR